MRNLLFVSTALVGVLSAQACGISDGFVTIGGSAETLTVVSADVGSGTVVLSNYEMTVGDVDTLVATAFNISGEPVSTAGLVWSSSARGVATVETVNGRGIVSALAPGNTVLTASVDRASAQIPTSVVPEEEVDPGPMALGAITLSPEAIFLEAIGATAPITVSAVDSLGATITPPITWRSTNPGAIRVSSGIAEALSFGSGYAVARSGCCSGDSIPVTASPPGTEGELDWFCDWSYGLGRSDAALMGQANGNDHVSGFGECFDGWTAVSGSPIEVVPVPTLPNGQNWPNGMTNVLRVAWRDDGGSTTQMVQCDSCWVPPAIGEYMFHRLYEYREVPPGERMDGHFYHAGNNDERPSEYATLVWKGVGSVRSDSTYSLQVGPGVQCSGCGGRGGGFFQSDGKYRMYRLHRIENRWHRVSATRMRLNTRVYDGTTDAPVLSGRDLLCNSGSSNGKCAGAGGYGVDTLGQYLTEYSLIDGWHSIELGNNGTYPTSRNTTYQWIGGVAVRVSADPDAWIGPYPVPGSREDTGGGAGAGGR